eukprot:4979825-Ditylum_brightwellii.AAC.1
MASPYTPSIYTTGISPRPTADTRTGLFTRTATGWHKAHPANPQHTPLLRVCGRSDHVKCHQWHCHSTGSCNAQHSQSSNLSAKLLRNTS